MNSFGLEYGRRIEQQRYMHIVQAFVCPGPGKHFSCITRNAVVAYKNKNSVAKIFFCSCCIHELLIAEISIAECIHFFIAFKSELLQGILPNLDLVEKRLIFSGNGVG